MYEAAPLSRLVINLTFLLCQSTCLTDAVASQVAEDGLCVAALPRQRHLLLHPGGGSAGQPGREGPPPLQLLLILAGRLDIVLRVCWAQPAPQGLTQGPDLRPVTQ